MFQIQIKSLVHCSLVLYFGTGRFPQRDVFLSALLPFSLLSSAHASFLTNSIWSSAVFIPCTSPSHLLLLFSLPGKWKSASYLLCTALVNNTTSSPPAECSWSVPVFILPCFCLCHFLLSLCILVQFPPTHTHTLYRQ